MEKERLRGLCLKMGVYSRTLWRGGEGEGRVRIRRREKKGYRRLSLENMYGAGESRRGVC